MIALPIEIFENLGIIRMLGPYESVPFMCVDDEAELICEAEVRFSGDEDEIEAEIQLVHQNPKTGQKPLEIIYWMRAIPHSGRNFIISHAKLKGKDLAITQKDWGEKGCHFFKLCAEKILEDKIPDFDEIEEKVMRGTSDFFGRASAGGSSSRSPKINTQELTYGHPQGRGF